MIRHLGITFSRPLSINFKNWKPNISSFSLFQELMDLPAAQPEASAVASAEADLSKILGDLQLANSERDELRQRCHELEGQLAMSRDEKANLAAECER